MSSLAKQIHNCIFFVQEHVISGEAGWYIKQYITKIILIFKKANTSNNKHNFAHDIVPTYAAYLSMLQLPVSLGGPA